MSHDDLRVAARRRPFEPFRIVLTTGAHCDIRHSDLIMVGKRAVVIGLTNDPSATAFDRTIKVDLLHVVAMEDLPTVRPSTNGPSA